MGTEPQPWSPAQPGAVLPSTPADAAAGPGTAPAPPSEPGVQVREPLYCSFCWANMPSGATECPDCGRSVDDMQAETSARSAADARWVPERMRESDDVPPEGATPVSVAPVTVRKRSATAATGRRAAPAAPRISLRWELVLIPILVVGLFVAAVSGGLWLGRTTFPHANITAVTPLRKGAPEAKPAAPAGKAGAPTAAPAPETTAGAKRP